MFSIAGLLATLAIIALIGFVAGFSAKYRRTGVKEQPDKTHPNRLAGAIRRILDVATIAILVGAVVLPLWTVANGLDLFSDPDVRHVDTYLGFAVDVGSADPSAEIPMQVGDSLIRGRTVVDVKTTSLTAWYAGNVISELFLLIFLYGLIQLRALFANFTRGDSFADENHRRIRNIGLAIIAWYVASPFLQFFGGRLVLEELNASVPGVQLFPAFELGVAGILVGLAMIVLARVLRDAAMISKEQALTI